MIRGMNDFLQAMQTATALLRPSEIEAAFSLLLRALREGRGVFLCGNGGSASTASHMAVDLGKNIPTGPGRRMRVISLTDNVAWLTAVANDVCYEDCFAEQLINYLQPRDLLIGISASGDSENMVRAFELAKRVEADRLAMIGFDGGRLAKLATSRVWVDSHDYGIVESVHLFIAHLLVRMLSEQIGRKEESDVLQQIPSSREPIEEVILNGKIWMEFFYS